MPSSKSVPPNGPENKPVPLEIPIIDLTGLRAGDPGDRQQVARQIRAACTDTGFFTIIGHGVPADLLARTRQAAEGFFAASDDRKRAVLRPPEKISRGWNPPADRTLANTLGADTPPDLQEAWAMGPPEGGPATRNGAYFTEGAGARFFAPNKWPELTGFQDTLTEYYRAMTTLSDQMMRGFALALDLDEDYFSNKSNRPCSIVRLVNYPAQRETPRPGQLRAGAHSDYGSFTFVRGDNVPGGLQVSDGNGGWQDIEAPEDGFVCNIGDTMQRWTGGRFRSTLHRVINPPLGAESRDRISLVYFHLPNHDAVLGGIDAQQAETPDDAAPTFAEHYFGKMVRAAKTEGGGSTVSAVDLVAGETV
ncbi:MAG: isopenicillin N synthase-like dioxygenase [Paracoccaceae bacterium]|jgi:isopenicillin N synthase-like dioxygenase